MTLRNGKFYDGERIVPLEFGNKDQISLMKMELQRIEAFKTGLPVEIDITTTYKGEINFKCECNACTVYFELEEDDEDDFDFVGETASCHKCKQLYEIQKDGDGDLIAVKKSKPIDHRINP
jgi:hypothetical protein